MQVQDRPPVFTQNQVKVPVRFNAQFQVQPLQRQKADVYFGKKDEDIEALLSGEKKAFGPSQKAMMGNPSFKELYETALYLPVDGTTGITKAGDTPQDGSEFREWTKAFEQIIRYALRDTNENYHWGDVTEITRNPAPKVSQVLEELSGMTYQEFLDKTKEPVLDGDALWRSDSGDWWRPDNPDGYVPTIPSEVYDRLAMVKAMVWKVPKVMEDKQIGGGGFSQPVYGKLIETLATIHDGIVASISATNTIGTGSFKFEDKATQEKIFTSLCTTGGVDEPGLTAFATTEPKVGTDLGSIHTVASLKKDADGYFWEVTGEKFYTTNFPRAQQMVITAQTDFGDFSLDEIEAAGIKLSPAVESKLKRGDRQKLGQTAVWIDLPFRRGDDQEAMKKHLNETLPARGIHVHKFLDLDTLRGSGQVHQRLDKVRVPVENVLSAVGEGQSLAMKGLSDGRAGVAHLAVGSMKTALHLVEEFVTREDRIQFKTTLADMDHVKGVVGNARIQLAGMEAGTELVAALIAKKGKDTELTPETSLIKAWAATTARKSVDELVELLGGRGYDNELKYMAPRMKQNVRILQNIEGRDEAMFQLAAGVSFLPILENLMVAPGWKKTTKFIGQWLAQSWGSVLSDNVNIPSSEQNWVRNREHAISRLIAGYGMVYGNALKQKQGVMVPIGRTLADTFVIKASMIKLAKYGDKLPAEERLYLKKFIKKTKVKVDERLSKLSKQMPEHLDDLEAGELAVQAVKAELNRTSPLDAKREKVDKVKAKQQRKAAWLYPVIRAFGVMR